MARAETDFMVHRSEQACPACGRGPRGIAGHESLFSHTMGAAEMCFLCRSCGRAWARKPAARGSFEWETIAAPRGAQTPGRPGTTPP